MNTLVVLSALVALAAAAPANSDIGSFTPQLQVDGTPVSSTPEKKSALPEDDAPVSDDGTLPEARTIGLKKKLILKRPHGYHKLFRDSSEEKSDSIECTKEVKVKYCGDEHASGPSNIKGITTESIHDKPMTEIEIKENLQKMKEDVENIQKMTEKNAKSANNAELQEDFEIARKALSNIQQSFDKLESLELRVATLSKGEALEDAKSDNERLAQWKGAMEKAQKHAESAKNTENSLISSEHQSVVQEMNSSTKPKSASLVIADDSGKPTEVKASEQELPLTIERSASNDMASAASEPKMSIMELKEKSSVTEVPVKVIDETIIEQPKKSKSSKLDVTLDNSLNMKSANVKSSVINDQTTMKSSAVETVMKSVPVFKAISENDHQIKVAVNNPTMLQQVQSLPQEDMKKKSANKQELEEHVPQESIVEDVMPIMKSSENIARQQISKQATNSPKANKEDFGMLMKAAKQEIDGNFDKQLAMKSADQQSNKQVDIDRLVPETKNVETVSVQQFEPSSLVAQEKSNSPAMKAANPEPQLGFHHGLGLSNTFHSHSHQISNSHHHLGHISHLGHPGIFKEADMNGEQSTLQMNMKEGTQKSALEQSKMQWNANQKSALNKNMLEWKSKTVEAMERGAYGAYGTALPAYGDAGIGGIAGTFGSTGSGTVGAVFPGSKHSSCAIPLLLSCSPSVVSGSLKSHSYGAPAYRADGSNLHSKRETKKIRDFPVKQVKRTLEKKPLRTSSTKMQL